MEVLSLLIGILYAYTQHLYCLIALAFLCLMQWHWRNTAVFLLGCLYALGHQGWIFSSQILAQDQVILKTTVEGMVASIPNVQPHKTQFQFLIDKRDGKKEHLTVLLAWYNKAPAIHTGERWRFTVKLKPPHNLNNPGSFDYVHWLAVRHVAMQGYIRTGSPLSFKPLPWSIRWLKIREDLGEKITKVSPTTTTAGITAALTLGLTQQINQEQWALFRRTGTTHLMVISGAHIGLVSGMIFTLIGRLWRTNAWCCLRLPAPRIASFAAIFTAFAYALLAGFAVPAQRSFLGAAIAGLRFSGKRRFNGWQVWRYALYFALLFEPHAVLLPGFYLSFLAVAILMLVNQRWRLQGLANNVLMQFSCLIGLTPLTLFWFGYGSLTGFIANMFAIPLVGFVIVPLSLVTMLAITCPLACFFMQGLNAFIGILMQLLTWVDGLSFLNINGMLQPLHRVVFFMGGLLVFVILPIKTFRLAAILLILSALVPKYPQPKTQEAWIRVLDVGQGLAVLVQTEKHSLIYDTGDRFYQGGDMGKFVILPFLETIGIKTLDAIVISHPDKDHYGGLASIEAAMPVKQLIVNSPRYYQRGLSCHDYPSWDWDGVSFRFFAIKKGFKEKNNRSCILQIRAGTKSFLLTGDIEKPAEHYLVENYGQQLQSTVLLVAHHGSKTSSSTLFLKTVKPVFAVASLGFDNRFHFPHPLTTATYKKLGIPFYTTEKEGMITIKLA